MAKLKDNSENFPIYGICEEHPQTSPASNLLGGSSDDGVVAGEVGVAAS